MAEYSDLEIYKEAYKLLIEVLHTIKHIRKDFKRTIGEELRYIAGENITLIQKANSTKDKNKRLEFLEKLKDNLEIFTVVLRSSKDARIVPLKTYTRLVEPLMETKKQSRKWYNYTKKK